MEWIFTDKRFSALLPFVGKYHFQNLVAESFCAAVVEKQFRNNGLPVPVCRDDTVRLSGRGGCFVLFCHWVTPFCGAKKGLPIIGKSLSAVGCFVSVIFTVRSR